VLALMTTTDAIKLSAAQALLDDAGVESAVFDTAAGGLWRAIIPMRLMVADDDAARGRWALRTAGFAPARDGDWDLTSAAASGLDAV
jgi:hypothetical protein